MNIKISTRHFNGSPELQQRVYGEVEKLSKFNDTITRVDVVLDAEKKNLRTAEFLFSIHGKTIAVHGEAENMGKAIDEALLKAERQLKKENVKQKSFRPEKLTEALVEVPVGEP